MRSRRHFIALLGLWLALTASAFAETVKVTFILTNDIYSMGDTAMPDGQHRGGFARLAAVVKAERAKARAEGRHVIFAHGGDTLSPSLMSAIDKGAHIVRLTNMIPPDIFAPGNHEFDFGKSIFLTRMAEAKFPIYAANLRGPDGAPLPGVKDRAVLEIDGVRVGLTGAAHDDTPRLSSSEDLKFLPTVATMRSEAAALRRAGADFVVAVMHADRNQGTDLAATGAFDLILTGHNHDLLVSYDGRTAMAESAYDAHYVTLVDVTITVEVRDGKRQVAWWPQFRIVDTAAVTPDPEVAAVVTALEAKLKTEMDVAIATTTVELDSRVAAVRTGEAAIGNLIADAMRSATHADAAVMNGGGIRGGRLYAPGSAITRRDVLAELPFGNKVVVVEIAGRDLRKALEEGLAQWPNSSGRFPQVSGIALTVDRQRPPGERIVSIAVAGAPLEPDRLYRIATNDFLARGGDGYVGFRSARLLTPLDDAPPLLNVVMDYVTRLGTIHAKVENRIALK